MRRFIPFIALGVLTVGALTVVGISLGNNSSQSSSTATIRFVYDFPGPDFALIPVVVAKEKGYFADQGLTVNVSFPPTTSTTALELSQGAGDIGFVTTTDMAVAVANKIPLVSVANYSMSNNWALFTKPGTPLSLSTLKGKTVFSYGDTWKALAWAALLAVLWLKSEVEEAALRGKYPEYAAYAAKVGRFVPGL